MEACRSEVSVRVGTVFEIAKVPMATIIRLFYFWSMRRSVDDAATELQVSRQTVEVWRAMFVD